LIVTFLDYQRPTLRVGRSRGRPPKGGFFVSGGRIRPRRGLGLLVGIIAILASCSTTAASRVGERGLLRPQRQTYATVDSIRGTWIPLAPGISIRSGSIASPRIRFAAARIELGTPTLKAVVSRARHPGSVDGATYGSSVSAFMRDSGCLVAINGTPFYPVSGKEGAGRFLVGISVSSGTLVSPAHGRYHGLFLSGGKATVERQDPSKDLSRIDAAEGGFFPILTSGVPIGDDRVVDARSAAGVSADGTILYLLAIEGGPLLVTKGASNRETGRILKVLGATEGLTLDGGASTALGIGDGRGEVILIAQPFQAGLRSPERVVGSVLGFALQEAFRD